MQEGVTSGARTTVLYDGSCPLCTAEIGLYRDLPGVEPVLEVTYRAFLKVRPAMVRLFVAVKRF